MTLRNAVAAAAVSAAGLAPAALPAVAAQTGIPARALQAYVTAASSTDACPGMRWSILAGIYRQESGHGTHGGATIDADGVVHPPILGVPVDWLDGDRAQGPGQFMTSSWAIYGHGGDPQDIDDAALATVRHLCGTFGDLEGDHLRGAVVAYYGADQDGYADSVLANVAAYDAAAPGGITGAAPAAGGPLVEDGIAGRVADRLTVRTLHGWQRLAGWLTGRSPELAPLVATIDGQVTDLTGVASGHGPTATAAPPAAAGGIVCPVPGGTITSDYGDARDGGARTHQGIDLADTEGTPVLAPFNARVVETVDVEADGGLGGLSVWLEAVDGPHKGARVYLAHNRRNTVRAGQTVTAGQQVAELGNTGVGTGPHSHVSWAPDGGAFTDPAPIRNACQEATK